MSGQAERVVAGIRNAMLNAMKCTLAMLGRDMKEALQQDSEELEKQANGEASAGSGSGDGDNRVASKGKDGKPVLSPEEKAKKDERERKQAEERAKAREERVSKLAEKLIRKLSIFTESVRNAGGEPLESEVAASFREITRIEADELKQERWVVSLGANDHAM